MQDSSKLMPAPAMPGGGPQGGPGLPGGGPEIYHLRAEHPADIPFLINRSQQRLGGFFSVSVVSHIGAVLLIAFLLSIAPPPIAPTAPNDPLAKYDLVWLDQPGPGGGGGGGGNESQAPVQKAEAPGKDRLTVQVTKPPAQQPPKQEKPPEPPPIEPVNIPALSMSAGLQTLPGTLDGIPDRTGSQGSGSGGGSGTGRGTGIGPGEGSGLGPGSGGGTGGGVYRPGSGVTTPRVIHEQKPQYTSEAMRAKIQGTVWVKAIVMADGSVGSVEIARSLDPVFGLDQEALKAARLWRFAPGMRLGVPVPVEIVIEMSFNLR